MSIHIIYNAAALGNVHLAEAGERTSLARAWARHDVKVVLRHLREGLLCQLRKHRYATFDE